jgi:nicotinate-nucleotide adenylyltransferase
MAKSRYAVDAISQVKMLNSEIQWPIEPIALMGGTFDPIHYGHLRCAEEVRLKLGLDTLYLLPAGNPVHRATPQASKAQRLDMLRLAQAEFPALAIDQRELDREGPSYMFDTLQEIRSQWPEKPLLLLLGQDSANDLHTWHRWQELFTLAHIIILSRPGSSTEYRQELEKQIKKRQVDEPGALAEQKAGSILPVRVAAIDICATTIKSMIRLGRSPDAMLPELVMAYIRDNGLYLPQPVT